MTSPVILPGAEPFFFPGGDTGCVLIHGLTGTPREMRLLGESLATAGHTVLGIRLAGHATQMDDLRRTRWEDWLTSVEDGVALLDGSCKRVVLIGLSLGGVLGLLAGSRLPVAGVAALATPLTPPDPRIELLRPFIPLLRHVLRDVAKGDGGWQDPTAAIGHLEYPAYPLTAIGELRDVLAILRRSLPELHTPLLLLSGGRDSTVPPSVAQQILERAGSREKRRAVISESGHVVTMDRGREETARLVREFVGQIAEGAATVPSSERPASRRLVPGGEPFLFRGGRVGCLLVHGFTATPQEMRGLGVSLAGQGYSVLGIRLAGHATRMDDMLRVRWTDWQADVEGGLQILRSLCDHVVIVGLSLGGALALLQGAAGGVAGVAALSTPFAIPASPRLRLARRLRGIWRFASKGTSDFRDPEASRARVAYPAYPVSAIAEVEATLQAMRRSLPDVHVPVLLMHAHDETFVPPENLSSIEAKLGSTKVTTLLVGGSNHILTCDAQRSLVWANIANFIERCTGGPA